MAPSFWELHHAIKNPDVDEVWCKGGRGSTKSSWISEEIVLGLEADPTAHSVVARRYATDLRGSVFAQMQWAAEKLGVGAFWKFTTSPMEATRVGTGQKIFFLGVDDPTKTKSIKTKSGYIKYFWGEEVDQFGGADALRMVTQSIRGEGGRRIDFFSFNPPRSARSWVNAETKIPKPGRIVHHSDYRTVPRHWLGEKFLRDAEFRQQIDEQTSGTTYRHEYLGEEVGTGLEIFNNIEIRGLDDREVAVLPNIRQGLDWGFAVDPVWHGRMSFDRKRRHLTIFGETSGVGIGNRQLNELTPEVWKRDYTRADSSEPKSIRDMADEFGWNIGPATKGPGSVEYGMKWLVELAKITIDPIRCPRAATEFVNYAHAVTRTGEVVQGYPDKDNHSIDGTRYALEDVMRPEPEATVARTPALSTVSRW